MKDVQNASGKGKKPGFFARIGKWFKDTFGELKKVTWPTFGETMKQLGAVLGVVVLFLLLLTVFDFVLGLGFDQFKKAVSAEIINLMTLLK